MNYETRNFDTGACPPGFRTQRNATEKDLVDIWFIKPLERMNGDDAFAALTLCFPLIESIIRYDLQIPDEQDVAFSDNSPALKWFAKFLTIPDADSRAVWDGLRNGLLHRAMIKGEIDYELTGDMPGRPAEVRFGKVIIYVWELRNRVLVEVWRLHKKLWKGTSSPLPRVYVRQ